MKPNSAKDTGRLVAAFLTGAWRREPPALDFSATDFEKIAPLLLQTGAGALGWWRLRASKLESCAAAEQLHEKFRLYTLETRLHKSRIEEVLALLRARSIEPILIKGWTAARDYPERGLRPYADIDLCVRAEEFQGAERALPGLDSREFGVGVHSGFAK